MSGVSSSRAEETRLHDKRMHESLIYLSLIRNNEYRSGNVLIWITSCNVRDLQFSRAKPHSFLSDLLTIYFCPSIIFRTERQNYIIGKTRWLNGAFLTTNFFSYNNLFLNLEQLYRTASVDSKTFKRFKIFQTWRARIWPLFLLIFAFACECIELD